MKWLEELRCKWLERKAAKAKPVYLIVCYAHWCIRTYAWAGEFVWDECCEDYVPNCFFWDDINGVKDTWNIRKITHTTTGQIYAWTFNKKRAEAMVRRLEKENG